MSEEKFTQGEWTNHLDGTIRNIDCTQVVGTYTMSGPFRNDEQKANANLMAVAPEMYLMLEDAMCLLAENDSECKALSKKIRLLRIKARGEHEKT
jgi:hypothetical protein